MVQEVLPDKTSLANDFFRKINDYLRAKSSTKEDFQDILNLLKNLNDVTSEIKSSWRDPDKLRGNLQLLRKKDKKTWVYFWLFVNKIDNNENFRKNDLWQNSPFANELPIVVRINENLSLSCNPGFEVEKALKRKNKKIKAKPGETFFFLYDANGKLRKCYKINAPIKSDASS